MPASLKEVAAKIEAEASAKLARGYVDLRLPIYDGRYAMRARVVDSDRLEEFQDGLTRLARNTDLTASEADLFAAEFVADACKVLLARPDKDGPWEPLFHDPLPGTSEPRPARFDEETAEALGLVAPGGKPVETKAECVLACWVTESDDGEPGEFSSGSFGAFTERLLTWMQDTNRRVEGEVVGGLPGGRA
jgi:hypothetical protein